MSDVFDRVVGYADFDQVDRRALREKVEIIREIMRPYLTAGPPKRILVAGCGEGSEAMMVRHIFEAETVGVDLGLKERSVSKDGGLELIPGDLSKLPFADNSFDFIYSYHVLEHVQDPGAVMLEMRRVLADPGYFFVGFPNRNRLVAYIGTHTGETNWEKIKWNLNDYKDRIMGRFENKYGAHAGFSQKEFTERWAPAFGKVIPVRNEYMLSKYNQHSAAIRFLIWTGLSEFAFPSNYFVLTAASSK